MGLNTLYLGIILAIITVGVGAGIFFMQTSQRTTQQTTTTTTTTSSPIETTTTSTTTTDQQSSIDISGTWEGTFTASRWPGEKTGKWRWVIYKVSDNKYEGYLMTMNVYPTGGYIKIEVTLDGYKITVGTVGGEFAAAVFSGTVTSDGNNAQGTWKFTGGQDSGEWSGKRVSMNTSLPVTTTTETETETTTTAQQTTTTTGSSQVQGCNIRPPETYVDAWNSIYGVLSNIFGSSNIACIMESSSNGQYTVYMNVTSYDAKQVNTYADNLARGFTSEGWSVIQKTVAENTIYLVMLKTFGNTQVQVLIEVDLSPSNGGIGIIMGQG